MCVRNWESAGLQGYHWFMATAVKTLDLTIGELVEIAGAAMRSSRSRGWRDNRARDHFRRATAPPAGNQALGGHLGEPAEDEPELDRHRLLTPQRAVIVEHRHALGRGQVVGAALPG